MTELALEQTLDLGDYLAAFRRRRGMIVLIAGTVFILGLITALVWPPTYESSATILIEEQEIPVEMVQTTVTSYAGQRIQVISQRVMTRANLLEIIDKYALYVDERKRETTEEVLDTMRKDIKVDMVQADVVDPRSGRPMAATIAFTVGFEGENPVLVQKVANELTTLYLNENLRTRTEKTEETREFIAAEAERLNTEIQRLEAALSAFKEKNIGLLPESRELVTQQIQRTQTEIDNITDQIRSAKETKVYLQGQLAVLDPYTTDDATDPASRLQALRTQYISLYSRYSPDHPDVLRTKREIAALEKEVGVVDTTADELAQLETLQAKLDKARQTYSDEHPDVKNLKRQIAAMEKELQKPASVSHKSYAGANPSNPAYVTLSSQLEAQDIQVKLLTERQGKLKQKIAEYEDRLLQMPKVEAEYRTLARDYENTTIRYRDLKSKQMTAEVAQAMEKERKGEKFTLIDPPILPEKPISPNRPAIIFLSLVLALGAGIGSAAAAESMDSAVRGAKGVISILNTAPLAVIPYLASDADIGRERKRRWLMITGVMAGIIVVLLLINFLYSPLDVLWFRGLRKIDNIVGG